MTSDVVGGMAGERGASGQAGLGNGWLAWTRRRFRQVWEVKRVVFLVSAACYAGGRGQCGHGGQTVAVAAGVSPSGWVEQQQQQFRRGRGRGRMKLRVVELIILAAYAIARPLASTPS